MTENSPLLQVSISAGYGKQTLLTEVQFTLSRGERLGLLGGSGAGKSTLLLALFGLLKHRGGWVKGEVLIEGLDLLKLPERQAQGIRGRKIALVPQSPLSALNPALSLQAQFEAAWRAHREKDKAALLDRASELMERVGLPRDAAFLRRKPGQISVGQAQRCALALALLHRPLLIVADEPTSALDPVRQNEVTELLRLMTAEEGAALLFVSHDLISVFRLCSEVAVLKDGRLTPRISVAEMANSTPPELEMLVRALPFPVEVLLRHTALAEPAPASAAPECTSLTLSS